jgi:general secretion pathway protein D
MPRLLSVFLIVAAVSGLAQEGPRGPTPFNRPPVPGRAPPPLPTDVDVRNRRAPPGTPTVPRPPVPQADDDRPGPDHGVVTKNGKFRLEFDKVDITDLVQNISDITGRMFIVPESIHGKITIVGPKHGKEWVTASEAYAAFLAALDANGLSLYQMGKYYKLVEKRDARRKAVPTYLDSKESTPADERYVTRLFRLKYADPDTVNGLMGELIGPDGMSRPFQPDLLIISDQALNLRRLEKIIEQIDVPSGGDEVRIVQVNYAAAADLAEKLTNIFQDKGGGKRGTGARVSGAPPPPPPLPGISPAIPSAPAGGAAGEESTVQITRVIADERTNKLVIVAGAKSFDRVLALVRQLDVPVPGEGQIHVYALENAVAEQMSTTLTNLIQGAAQGKAHGGVQGPSSAPTPQTSVFEGQVKISPDKTTNSLVILATGTDYTNLAKVIQKLDIPRRQVFVEAVIMEVDLQNDLQFGAASHYIANVQTSSGTVPVPFASEPFGVGKGLNSLGGVQGVASLGGFLTGLQGPANTALSQALGVSVPSFAFVLQALETSSDTNIISTPHILTSDNEEAEIVVGQNVPFQSGYSTLGIASLAGLGAAGTGGLAAGAGVLGAGALGAGLPIGQIQRTNVELKLKLKPQINEGDFVRLNVDESEEEIASQDPVLGPTTAKRSTKTVIVCRDQETVVIGGLIQEQTTRSSNRTPILGDIPVIGWLFRYDTTSKRKRNLLLFLTPYIIRDQSDFRAIFERKMEERRAFIERFYGETKGYQVPIDYGRKVGPVAHISNSLRKDENRIENGGTGVSPGERSIKPEAKKPPQPPPPPVETPDTSDDAPAPPPPPESSSRPVSPPSAAEPIIVPSTEGTPAATPANPGNAGNAAPEVAP